MNFHCPVQPCLRPRANARLLQQLNNQKVFSRLGDRKLWVAVVKVLLILCPMFLAVNLWLASAANKLELPVQAAENVRHQLIDTQISLRAKRDQLYAPERIRIIAAEQLSLYVPEKE